MFSAVHLRPARTPRRNTTMIAHAGPLADLPSRSTRRPCSIRSSAPMSGSSVSTAVTPCSRRTNTTCRSRADRQVRPDQVHEFGVVLHVVTRAVLRLITCLHPQWVSLQAGSPACCAGSVGRGPLPRHAAAFSTGGNQEDCAALRRLSSSRLRARRTSPACDGSRSRPRRRAARPYVPESGLVPRGS